MWFDSLHKLIVLCVCSGPGLCRRSLRTCVQTGTRWTSSPRVALRFASSASWSLCCPHRSWASAVAWLTAVSLPHSSLWAGSGCAAYPLPSAPSWHEDASPLASHAIWRNLRVRFPPGSPPVEEFHSLHHFQTDSFPHSIQNLKAVTASGLDLLHRSKSLAEAWMWDR